jgi:hypothetical protein
VDGAIECVGGVEYVEGNWMDYEEFTGFSRTSLSMSAVETSSVGGGGRRANSTAGFTEIVCLRAAERIEEGLLLGWLLIGIGVLGASPIWFLPWVNPLLVLGGILQKWGTSFIPPDNNSPDGLRLLDTIPNRQQHLKRARCLYLGQSSESIQALKQKQLHRSGESDHVTPAVD